PTSSRSPGRGGGGNGAAVPAGQGRPPVLEFALSSSPAGARVARGRKASGGGPRRMRTLGGTDQPERARPGAGPVARGGRPRATARGRAHAPAVLLVPSAAP